MAKKTMTIKSASAFVVNGEIITPGNVVDGVPESAALNLIQRGKAVKVEDGDEDGTEMPELADMTVAELKDVAEEHSIEGASSMKKAELIAAIEATESAGD